MELFFHPNPNRASSAVLRGGEDSGPDRGYWSLRRKLPSGINYHSVEDWLFSFVNGSPMTSDLARRWAAAKMGATVALIANRAKDWNETRQDLISAGYQPLTTQVPLERLCAELKGYWLGKEDSVSDDMDLDRVRNELSRRVSGSPVLKFAEGQTRFWLDMSAHSFAGVPAQILRKGYIQQTHVWN